jgi:hypothetical protein
VLRTTAPSTAPFAGTRRRRPPRQLDPFGVGPKEETAAMGDVAEANALFDDLLALLDAGLIAAVEQQGGLRYTAHDDDAAGFGEPVTVGQRP